MTGEQNKKRKHSRKGQETRTLWGFLFRKDSPEDDINSHTFFNDQGVSEEDVADPAEEEAAKRNLLQELWHRFNFWSCVAILLFLAFVGVVGAGVFYMWVPQDLKDVAGYNDMLGYTDITAAIRNADGSEISFTEAEINRYLRGTCRMRQTGAFSIFAHAQGVAVRIHDGYVEVVIDRVVGVNMHQTTAVNLTFSQVVENGSPVLEVDFQGGPPILGDMPCGGSIGSLRVPKRHMEVLKPALETLMDCYPDITDALNRGYLPVFTEGRNGEESRVTLKPFHPNT